MNTKLSRPTPWRDLRVFLLLLYINYTLLGCAVVLMFIDYPSGSLHKV